MKRFCIKILIVFCLSLISIQSYAAQISVIDFTGKQLGKVLPDGKVLNAENNLIGSVNADSQVVNQEGDIIGGIVPQGIAIGNDFKVLGRITPEGGVLTPSGRSVGRVLPNALVVNDAFDVIGAVLFPGIVYSNNGKYIGRLSGNGSYTNIQGKSIGFITPDGFAYKKIADKYVLDGRLISSKMVSSLKGGIIGSINSQGQALDSNQNVLAQIRANGFAYNKNGDIVGSIINGGYAFYDDGEPMGFVSFDGTVLKNDKQVGFISFDNTVINNNGEPIGFALSSKAVATSLNGSFLGIVLPTGSVSKGEELKGFIGPKGVVLDKDGNLIGSVIKTGPVFDYKSNIISHSLSDGKTRSLNGTINGKTKGFYAYDLNGNITGEVYQNIIATNLSNEFLGLNGIDNKLVFQDILITLSNNGYAFDDSGTVIGQTTKLGRVYNQQGRELGFVSPNGEIKSSTDSTIGKLVGKNLIVDDAKKIIAKTFFAQYITKTKLLDSLLKSANNLLMNKGKKIEAKILPDSSIVATSDASSINLMPNIGKAFEHPTVVSYNAKFVGVFDYDNALRDSGFNNVGFATQQDIAIDNNGLPVGEIIGFGPVVDFNCSQIGVLDIKGQAKNARDILLGKSLANNFILSEGAIIGYKANSGVVVNNDGVVIGHVAQNAQVYDFSNKSLGCINPSGYLKKGGITLGKIVEHKNVINFDNKMIGRSTTDGKIINKDSSVIGFVKPTDEILSDKKEPLGLLFKYRYAFDNNNAFMGVIDNNAQVINTKGEAVAKVMYDGKVYNKNQVLGFALYDLYVYDKEGKPFGYINFSGEVLGFDGSKLGLIKKGFLVDEKDVVLARGNRDYYIRTSKNQVIGNLKFDNRVINSDGKTVGILNSAGEVLDSNSNVVAIANPLQYHSTLKAIQERRVVLDKDNNIIGYADEAGNVYDKNGNIIGKTTPEGNVIDKDGNVIGKLLSQEEVYDEEGNLIGTTNSDGSVVDLNNKKIGTLNDIGEVISPNGNIIGGINKNWYEKITAPNLAKDQQYAVVEDYIRAVSIALTPDGEYLGEILPNGNVVDKNGKIIGKKQPDGLIIDDQGTLIGIEEIEKKQTEDLFVPAGSVGLGGAYGTGNDPQNLGPGGGYGPGERYDPTRARALAIAQAQRRQNLTVGAVKSTYNPSSFNYMQDNWEGVPSTLSSWRVDMSEMILADKPIPAVLARSVYNTSTEVPVTAYVERNVYSEEGRNVIIPAGSRIIGSVGGFGDAASGEVSSNATKVEITWERLIKPDGSMFNLSGSVTGDAQGRQGALGYVDKQLGRKYISPILVSVLTSAGAYMIASSDESTTDVETSQQQAASDARQNFINSMDSVFQEVLNDKLNLRDLVFVPAGTRIIVYPKKDLWLRNADRDVKAQKFDSSTNQRVEGLISEESQGQSKSGENSSSNSNQVVYDSNTTPQAQQGGGLVNSKSAQPQQQTPVVIPPPPPPSSSQGATSKKPSSSSSNNSNTMAPVLF